MEMSHCVDRVVKTANDKNKTPKSNNVARVPDPKKTNQLPTLLSKNSLHGGQNATNLNLMKISNLNPHATRWSKDVTNFQFAYRPD